MRKIKFITTAIIFIFLCSGMINFYPGRLQNSQRIIGYSAKALTINSSKTVEKPPSKQSVIAKIANNTIKAASPSKVVGNKATKAASKQIDEVNIALFGIDTVDKISGGRSDTVIVLTIDFTHKKLKLTSFLRDLYVHIPGHGYSKLGHAYAYGGPKLALKTLNENFGLDLKYYCVVDFLNMARIVNTLGGVRVNIKGDEISFMNCYDSFTQSESKIKAIKITKAGFYLLNGDQALAYSRIRHIGKGDFDRTERQRTVLTELIKGVRNRGESALTQLVEKIHPLIFTNISNDFAFVLGFSYFKAQPLQMEEQRFPVDGNWKSTTIKGVYYLKSDLNICKSQVTKYIYEDVKPSDLKRK